MEKGKVENKVNNKSSSRTIVILALLLLLFAGIGIYGFYGKQVELNAQKSMLDSISTLNANFKNELLVLKNDFENLKVRNKELEELLRTANIALETKEKKIRHLVKDNASINTLRKEIQQLKTIRDGYSKRIQELEEEVRMLKLANNNLTKENEQLKFELAAFKQKNTDLQKKVDIASIIKTDQALVFGEKAGKGGKFVPVKLRKAERLMVAFTLDENKVAEPGEKIFYIKVTSPDGKVIQNSTSGNFINNENNISTPYTAMHTVNYSNKKTDVKIPVDLAGSDHPKGTYTLEFFCNGYFSGLKKIKAK